MLSTYYYMDERLHPFLFNKNKMKKRIWFLCFFFLVFCTTPFHFAKKFLKDICACGGTRENMKIQQDQVSTK
jgi:hypothetical protein